MGTLLAQSSGTLPNSTYAFFWAALICAVCYINKKKAIGGWLLFYFIQLYLSTMLDAILNIAGISVFSPASWGNIKLYILNLITTIPTTLFLLTLTIMSFWMIPKRKRSWKVIKIVKVILILDLVFSLMAVIVDSIYWPDARYFSIVGLIWTTAWLSYFSRSKRVHAVYLSRDWGDLFKQKSVSVQAVTPKPELTISKTADHKITEFQSDPELARTRVSVGKALLHKGEYEEAEKEYLGAIRLEPNLMEAHYGLARCYACRNMKREALDCLRLAIENGFGDLPSIENERNFMPLRDDPWYRILVEIIKKRWEERLVDNP